VRETFASVVAAAVRDIAEHGYDSKERIEAWVTRIVHAAYGSSAGASSIEHLLRRAFTAKYNAALTTSRKYHSGLDRFTLARVAPAARAELDRRIVAAAQLIRLNRQEAISTTMRRFVGWATSIPPGGEQVERRAEARVVKKALAQLPFLERRVAIDQGTKLISSINAVIAKEAGAIAGRWRHKHQTAGYQARPEHVARDGDVFLLPDSWAMQRHLVTGPLTTSIEEPGELVYCGCWYEYLYHLRQLPEDMLTQSGRDIVAQAKQLSA
jgi:hypothetical protein